MSKKLKNTWGYILSAVGILIVSFGILPIIHSSSGAGAQTHDRPNIDDTNIRYSAIEWDGSGALITLANDGDEANYEYFLYCYDNTGGYRVHGSYEYRLVSGMYLRAGTANSYAEQIVDTMAPMSNPHGIFSYSYEEDWKVRVDWGCGSNISRATKYRNIGDAWQIRIPGAVLDEFATALYFASHPNDHMMMKAMNAMEGG